MPSLVAPSPPYSQVRAVYAAAVIDGVSDGVAKVSSSTTSAGRILPSLTLGINSDPSARYKVVVGSRNGNTGKLVGSSSPCLGNRRQHRIFSSFLLHPSPLSKRHALFNTSCKISRCSSTRTQQYFAVDGERSICRDTTSRHSHVRLLCSFLLLFPLLLHTFCYDITLLFYTHPSDLLLLSSPLSSYVSFILAFLCVVPHLIVAGIVRSCVIVIISGPHLRTARRFILASALLSCYTSHVPLDAILLLSIRYLMLSSFRQGVLIPSFSPSS